MTSLTKVNELSLCRSGGLGSDWPSESNVCGGFRSGRTLTLGGMSIPFVDPWEQSSISLLGTALMRPGILPFIPHSLQLGTAHSFRYGHSEVFVYTDTMQMAKTAHSPPQSRVRAHAPPTHPTPPPRIPAKLRL